MEELTIVKNVNVGLRDIGKPCLWFVCEGIAYSSLQIFLFDDNASDIIKASGCYSLKEMEGKPCVIRIEGNRHTFVRWKK